MWTACQTANDLHPPHVLPHHYQTFPPPPNIIYLPTEEPDKCGLYAESERSLFVWHTSDGSGLSGGRGDKRTYVNDEEQEQEQRQYVTFGVT